MANDLVERPAGNVLSIEAEIDARFGVGDLADVQWFRDRNLTHFTATLAGFGWRRGVNEETGETYSYPTAIFRGRSEDIEVRLMKENVKQLHKLFGPLSEGRARDQKVTVWLNPDVMFGTKRTGGVRFCAVGETPWARPGVPRPPERSYAQQSGRGDGQQAPQIQANPEDRRAPGDDSVPGDRPGTFARDLDDEIPF